MLNVAGTLFEATVQYRTVNARYGDKMSVENFIYVVMLASPKFLLCRTILWHFLFNDCTELVKFA